jgi:RsiW-degrading membrane proteinase PrsW (M82 family)
MENFKLFFAYVIALVIMIAGLTCSFSYLNSHENNNLLENILTFLATSVILFPAFDFWLDVCKKILGLKNK